MAVRRDWSREENQAIVADYLSMLETELKGQRIDKTAHRRRLMLHLHDRSEGSIEFKHQNITAALNVLGFPTIAGYKERSNLQRSLLDVVRERLEASPRLQELAARDSFRKVAQPQPTDILSALTDPPTPRAAGTKPDGVRDSVQRSRFDYIAQEGLNRELGKQGELFVLEFERARLRRAGADALVGRIEHVSHSRGDGDGFDILSYEISGKERLIEVKTTKYSIGTPFYLTPNEVSVSRRRSDQFHLYRVFAFGPQARLFTLPGSLEATCSLWPASYRASVR